MTATNHALSGAIIGLTISNPFLAIPLSLASHYVLDTMPHFGQKWDIKSKQFAHYLIAEALICLLIVLIMLSVKPSHYYLGIVCAFVAAAPDLLSANFYIKTKFDRKHKASKYFLWAKNIQKKESADNFKFELAWGLIFVSIYIGLLTK